MLVTICTRLSPDDCYTENKKSITTMKILIVGGGVAGTALAGMLKDHADITLVERAQKWSDAGYAITLWGNGRKILKQIGADVRVEQKGYELPWVMFSNSRGQKLKRIFWSVFQPLGGTIITTRTNLHEAIIATMSESVTVRFGMSVDEIEQSDNSARVTFSDGSTGEFDLVVGADGIHSKVRDLVFGAGLLKDYGWKAYAFWSPSGHKVPKGNVGLARAGKICLVYPTQDRAVVILAISEQFDHVDIPEQRRQNLKELFAEFDPSVASMIDAIEDPAKMYHDKFSYVDLDEWHRGRVALMGDAQHATSPIIGMGASMALEDAYVLGSELRNITMAQDIPYALQRYADRRTPRIRAYRRTAIFFERWLMTRSPLVTAFRDAALPRVTDRIFTRPMEKLLKQKI